jgi:anti-anti-sigma factor
MAKKEVLMTASTCSEEFVMKLEAGNLTELVRGRELGLVEELTPLVRRRSVLLNLEPVERIDAAGIAALVSLYRIARESGHRFRVSNASSRVAETLALVGLDGVLLSQNAEQASESAPVLAQNAA